MKLLVKKQGVKSLSRVAAVTVATVITTGFCVANINVAIAAPASKAPTVKPVNTTSAEAKSEAKSKSNGSNESNANEPAKTDASKKDNAKPEADANVNAPSNTGANANTNGTVTNRAAEQTETGQAEKPVDIQVNVNKIMRLTGNIEAGKQKAAACAACHGPDGNSINPIWPSLAGQHAKYTVTELLIFKQGAKGARPNAMLMVAQAANLTNQDMADIAAYYASLKAKSGTAQSKDIKLGARLYRGGDLDKHIAACMACHGPKGRGNASAPFPALAGQQPEYIVAQLKLYKSGERSSGINNIMQSIAKRMSEKEMTAVANYIHGLH